MTRSSSSPLATLFFVLGTIAITACSGTTQQLGGGDAGSTASSGLALGEKCECKPGDGEQCCESGLICDNCVALTTGMQCSSSNWKCQKPRVAGQLCDSAAQCEPGATCVDSIPGDGDARPQCTGGGSSSSGSLAPGRCRESLDCGTNEVCVDSHCKLAKGAPCTSNSACASNACYGEFEGCR